MVTNGDVIYVYPAPRKPEAPPPLEAAEPAAFEQHVDPRPQQPPVEEPIVVRTGLDRWTYTPAPPGYAHEFGTGRLVPVHPSLIPG